MTTIQIEQLQAELHAANEKTKAAEFRAHKRWQDLRFMTRRAEKAEQATAQLQVQLKGTVDRYEIVRISYHKDVKELGEQQRDHKSQKEIAQAALAVAEQEKKILVSQAAKMKKSMEDEYKAKLEEEKNAVLASVRPKFAHVGHRVKELEQQVVFLQQQLKQYQGYAQPQTQQQVQMQAQTAAPPADSTSPTSKKRKLDDSAPTTAFQATPAPLANTTHNPSSAPPPPHQQHHTPMQPGSSGTYVTPTPRNVACLNCHQHFWEDTCIQGEPCRNCVIEGAECVRPRCADYEAGACRKGRSCKFAHEDDLYTVQSEAKKLYRKVKVADRATAPCLRPGQNGAQVDYMGNHVGAAMGGNKHN